MRLPCIVITCARIDLIKRVSSEPPCCRDAFSDFSSVHDNYLICDMRRYMTNVILLGTDNLLSIKGNGFMITITNIETYLVVT